MTPHTFFRCITFGKQSKGIKSTRRWRRKRASPTQLHGEWLESRQMLTAELLVDINPTGDSSPSSFVELNGKSILTATDADHGREL